MNVKKIPKILHIETGKHLYGGAKQVYYLLSGLKQKKYGENILICSKGSDIYMDSKELCKTYPIKIDGDMDLFFLFRLLKIIKKEDPHIIHIHSRRGADTFGLLAAKITNKKVIITRRVDNPEPSFIAKIKYNHTDKVVTISKGIYEILIKEGVKKEKIEIIPSAVDFNFYNRRCDHIWFNEKFNISKKVTKIGMIAQFIPRKGHEFLLDSIPLILDKTRDVIFILFGKGPLQQKILKLIYKRNLEKYVKIAGFVRDIENYIPCLDILVHPAYMEGLGVSLLQANAAGVPIVASKVGGILDVISHGVNGFLFTPGDKHQFSTYVIDLIFNNEKRRIMGSNGQTIVKEKFSISSMVNNYIKIYDELTNIGMLQ